MYLMIFQQGDMRDRAFGDRREATIMIFAQKHAFAPKLVRGRAVASISASWPSIGG